MTLDDIKKKVNDVKDVEELVTVINNLACMCCKKCSDENGYEDSCSYHNQICTIGLKNIIKQ